jgi:DNA-binding winged helix-turn-helix (wHTH) protein/class 3 adenylate cyclase/predicted ATPase
MIYRFLDFSLDTGLHELRRSDRPLRLRPKVFSVLTYLIEHKDRVVSKKELLDTLWAGLVVDKATLATCIMEARRALGDSGIDQKLIQTVHGCGYRFVASVEPAGGATDAGRSTAEGPVAIPGTTSVEPAGAAGGLPGHAALEPARLKPPSASPAAGGEHKIVTVLVCRLAGADHPAAAHRPEEMHERMKAFYDLALEVAARFGGTLLRCLEDGVIVVFGAPRAHEDHAGRAALAAFDLRKRIAARWAGDERPDEMELSLQMGLHTGPVVCSMAANSHLVVTPIGDTLELAGRLQRQASPGSILLSEVLHADLKAEVRTRAVQPQQGSGIRAFELVSVKPAVLGGSIHAIRASRGLTTFFGRRRELSILKALWERVEQGHGQVVGLMGDPGMGKSRLMYEFARSLEEAEAPVQIGHCVSYRRNTPYLPVLEWVRRRCGISEADGPEAVVARIHHLLDDLEIDSGEAMPFLLLMMGIGAEAAGAASKPANMSAQHVKARTFEVLSQLIINHARHEPLLLAMEDLHWIDATSEEWLVSLEQQLAGSRVLLLLTYRPGYRPTWLDRSYSTQLALQPLGSRESRALFLDVLGDRFLPEETIAAILSRAEGNPFFLEELALSFGARDDGEIVPEVPESVMAVLTARMDRLPPDAKRLLQTAAVVGREVPSGWLAAISEQPGEVLQQSLAVLHGGEFLHEVGHYSERVLTFKHALTRHAAYQSMSLRDRRQIHRKVAGVLAERFPEVTERQPELLAHHYVKAGMGAESIPFWQKAGQRAIERSANQEAVNHLSRGLKMLKSLPEGPERELQELELLLRLGTALVATRGHASPEVEKAFTRAKALCYKAGERPQLFPAMWGLGMHFFVQGNLRTAKEIAEQLLSLAGKVPDPSPLLGAHFMLGLALNHLGEWRPSLDHFEKTLALYDTLEHRNLAFVSGEDPAVLAGMYAANILFVLGYPDQSREKSREALKLARSLAHPHNLTVAYYTEAIRLACRRDYRETRQISDEAVSLASRHGFRPWVATSTMLKGWAQTMLDRDESGLNLMLKGLTAHRVTGTECARTAFLALMADACLALGQWHDGLRAIDEALSLVEKNDERFFEAELYRLRGELLLRLSDPEIQQDAEIQQPEAAFLRALDVAHMQQAKVWELRAATSLARLWRNQGKVAEARRVLSDVYSGFNEGFDALDLQEAKALLDSLDQGEGRHGLPPVAYDSRQRYPG